MNAVLTRGEYDTLVDLQKFLSDMKNILPAAHEQLDEYSKALESIVGKEI